MRRRFEFGAILLIAALATLPLHAHGDDDERAASSRPIAYVVCGDAFYDDVRAYRIDVLAGSVLNISEPIEWAGAPELLVFDSNQSRLIIGSWSKPERAGEEPDSYVWPVTVLRVGGGEFRVVNRLAINRENYTAYPANPKKGPPELPQARVYRLALSPDGNSLYLGHSELAARYGAEVWDSHSGKTIRWIDALLVGDEVWSPDGKFAARLEPSFQFRRRKYGKFTIERIDARISVIDVVKGEEKPTVYLDNNMGLHPPWGRIEEPFIHYDHRSRRVEAYDRDTGRKISDFGVHEVTERGVKAASRHFATLQEGRLIVMSLGKRTKLATRDPATGLDFTHQGYVALIDVIEPRAITRVEVGDRCTAPVLAYE